MSNAAINGNLEIQIDFEKSLPGDPLSDACMQQLADKMRITFVAPEELTPEVCVANDSDNIATKEPDGCIRVQKDLIHKEQKDVPVPTPDTEAGDTYLVPITDFRINGIVLENGSIVDVTYGGQTSTDDNSTPEDPSDDTYEYPADLAEFVDNLNGETSNFTWAVNGGQLVVTSDLGTVIRSVIAGGVDASDPTSVVEVAALESEVPGDVTLTFQGANAERGIDYTGVFNLHVSAVPGDGFDKIWISETTNDRVTVKITSVSKVLSATLLCDTPASREAASEF